MQKKARRHDENYIKCSKHKQWQERAYMPIATEGMSRDKIEEHRQNLIKSYDVEPGDITYEFIKIKDENDDDRDDCLWLVYHQKRLNAGKMVKTPIFTIKVTIPDEVKKMAEEHRRQTAARSRGPRLLTNEPSPPQQMTEGIARPKLKKPIPRTALNKK